VEQLSREVLIGEAPLGIGGVVAVARASAAVRVGTAGRARIAAAHAVVDRVVRERRVVYGVTTGFGQLATTHIPVEQARELQENLVRSHAVGVYRGLLERLQERIAAGGPCWNQPNANLHDAYAFTLLRWGGFAGIDPASLPGLKSYVESRMTLEPMAAALARERIALDSYKPAA